MQSYIIFHHVMKTLDWLTVKFYLNESAHHLQSCLVLKNKCWFKCAEMVEIQCTYRWISWRILPWELEGITSPCCLLIGQYPHHMTLCPPVAIVKRCFGIHL